MKKIMLLSFILVFIFSLVSCWETEEKTNNKITKIEQKDIDNKEIKDQNNEENINSWVTQTWSLETNSGSLEILTWAIEENKKDEIKNNKEVKEEVKAPISTKTMLIFDASGSMRGQIKGEAKIDIAKEVIKNTVQNFEDTTELGLMAYGHRTKWDCKDIEVLVEASKWNWDNISKLVSDIIPKWMTPMWDSVIMAAENLKYSENKATIILVSDWIETYGVDLCQLWKKLEETWVDFTAHTIGFDMTEEQSKWLKCLAEETGGKFMSASDADSLWEAIEKAVEESSCSIEKLWKATITIGKEIPAGLSFDVEFTGPENYNDWIAIVPKDSIDNNEHIDHFYIRNNWRDLRSPEDLAEYDVVYFAECGTILGRSTFKVTAISATISVQKEVAAGSDFDVIYTWPKNKWDKVALLPKGWIDWNDQFDYFYVTNHWIALTAPEIVWEYDVVYMTQWKEILARDTFKVTPVTASIDIPNSITIDTDFDVIYTGPKNSWDWVTILPKWWTNSNDHLDYFYTTNSWIELTSPKEVWEYDVVYMTKGKNILARETLTTTK